MASLHHLEEEEVKGVMDRSVLETKGSQSFCLMMAPCQAQHGNSSHPPLRAHTLCYPSVIPSAAVPESFVFV